MNGLPTNLNLTSIVGREVIQLCFGAHQLQIHFESNIRVMVESECVLQGMSPNPIRVKDYLGAASTLCRMIGVRVLLAARADDGGLLLHFANDAELHVLNDSQKYESFQLHIDGEVYAA